jgi:hypothetical protein
VLPVRESLGVKKLLRLQGKPPLHRVSHVEQRVDFFRNDPDGELSVAAGTVVGSTRCFVFAFAIPQTSAIHCLQKTIYVLTVAGGSCFNYSMVSKETFLSALC